jgi:hypothetical protein
MKYFKPWKHWGAAGTALGALMAFLALSLPSAAAGDKIGGRLFAKDALTMPGRPVVLEAWLVKEGMLSRTGLGGEPLEFIVANRSVGTAMTGGDGRAFLEYTPRMRGNQSFTVKIASSKRVESRPGTATVACWERRRPILVVDGAALSEAPKEPLAPLPSLPLDIVSQDDPTPLADAAGELKRLSDYYYNVLYLNHAVRDDGALLDEQRAWLSRHHFPIGLIRHVKPTRKALDDLLDALKAEGWDNVKAGVGRTREFAEAFDDRRITVVILPAASRDETVPRKATLAKDWKAVRAALQH